MRSRSGSQQLTMDEPQGVFFKELLVVAFLLLPIIYLLISWSGIPAEIPMHYDIQGNIDRYGNRGELWLLVGLLNIPVYLLLLGAPYLDYKKSIPHPWENSYLGMRAIMQVCMAAVTMIIIQSSLEQGLDLSHWIMPIVTLCLAILGYFMRNLKQNQVAGIRTAATLNDERVWNKTHQHVAMVWLFSGIMASIPMFFFSMLVSVIVLLVWLFGLFGYSMWYAKKVQQEFS
jgi:uncharacterized membrane protein